MTEPMLEEMEPQSYVRRPSLPVRAVRWNGSNWDEVHAVYPTLGEEYMRGRGCREGDWVISPNPGRVDFMSHETFSELYTVAAPESEDEAFERWWTATHPTYLHSVRDEAKAAWNARARLSAGGK